MRPESFVLPALLDGAMRGYGVAPDANQDGTVDLVFSGAIGGSSGTGRVYFFFGDGLGGLLPRGEAALRVWPAHILAADIVGLNDVDLLLTNARFSSVTVLRGGGGRFADLGDFAVGVNPIVSAAGDFDGDGSMDFATADGTWSALSLAFGNGAGAWSQSNLVLGSRQGGIRSADFDRDGFADLAVSLVSPPRLAVLFGSATRGFTTVNSFSVGATPAEVAVADADGDGNLDVIVGDATTRAFRILFGDGARGFGRTAAVGTPFPPLFVSIGDATGDGIPDALTAHGASRAFSVLPGDGRGGFGAATTFHALDTASSVFVTDLGEDGTPEVVVPGNGGPGSLCRLRETALSACLRGTVDLGRGPARDVLFVNSRSGGHSRTIRLRPSDPLSVLVTRPPAAPAYAAAFVMYAWLAVPTPATVRALPARLGSIALPMPLVPGAPAPREIWNGIGKVGRLGVPTQSSSNAPSFIAQLPRGFRRTATFTLQGIIIDPGALNGRAAVTNRIVVEIR